MRTLKRSKRSVYEDNHPTYHGKAFYIDVIEVSESGHDRILLHSSNMRTTEFSLITRVPNAAHICTCRSQRLAL